MCVCLSVCSLIAFDQIKCLLSVSFYLILSNWIVFTNKNMNNNGNKHVILFFSVLIGWLFVIQLAVLAVQSDEFRPNQVHWRPNVIDWLAGCMYICVSGEIQLTKPTTGGQFAPSPVSSLSSCGFGRLAWPGAFAVTASGRAFARS